MRRTLARARANRRCLAGIEIDQVGGFSTHTMSPALFMRQLEDLCGARILMLAVQPASTAFGQCLSREVEACLEELVTVFEEAFA